MEALLDKEQFYPLLNGFYSVRLPKKESSDKMAKILANLKNGFFVQFNCA